MATNINLTGGSPWGFRLVGGKDFRTNLAVSKVTPGGKAELAGITPGMILLSINDEPTKEMTHMQAQNKVKSAANLLKLSVESSKDSNISSTTTSTYTKQSSSPAPVKQTSSVTFTPYQPSKAPASHPPSDFLPPPPPSVTHGHVVDDTLPPPPSILHSDMRQENSGDSDPVCEGCRKIIVGPYVSHQGKNWHPDEFVCSASNCRKPLQNEGFIEEKGKRYCKSCYEKHFAHECGKCHQKITGEVMHALNQTWHMKCFVCFECRETFKDGVFQMKGDKPYCIKDYNIMFSEKCKGCDLPVVAGEEYVEAMGSQWHNTCFNCTICHCDLGNKFYSANGRPVCNNHRNAHIA